MYSITVIKLHYIFITTHYITFSKVSGWAMGQSGHCMIFGVEVGCTEGDRDPTGLVDLSRICGVSGIGLDISEGKYLYFDTVCKKVSAKYTEN